MFNKLEFRQRFRLPCRLVVVISIYGLSGPQANAQWTSKILNSPGLDFSYGQGVGNGDEIVGQASPGFAAPRAIYWSGQNFQPTDLTPSGWTSAEAWGASPGSQVGFGYFSGGDRRALLWHGTSESAINLHPVGYLRSEAYGVDGNVVSGMGFVSGKAHAVMWNGSATNFLDLHPQGYSSSEARSVSGDFIGGFGNIGSRTHALLWRNTPESVVDLHPAGFDNSHVAAINGDLQAGAAILTLGIPHAAVWRGTAASFEDLNPTGVLSSGLNGVFGDFQVGNTQLASSASTRAAFWNGTASSYLDLHQFLPPNFTDSAASSIHVSSDRITIAGYAMDRNVFPNAHYAVIWTRPVPEPGTIAVFTLGSLCLVSNRRKRSKP